MKIKENLWVSSKKDGIWSNLSGEWKIETESDKITICKQILTISKSHDDANDKHTAIEECIRCYENGLSIEEKLKIQEEAKNRVLNVCTQLIDFFKDFEFEPNFRFVNTLKHNCTTIENARQYVCNYFRLTDNNYKSDIIEKTKSLEFKQLINELSKVNTSSTINSRFKVFYGSQGTGKTTQALKESNNVVMVCHSAMLPSDLLEDFKFEDGKPTFTHSALWNAMENGSKITLDEINLLPFESLRFLQSILDNKTEICYKGQTIHIKDGFQIIGTMNLTVNGNVFNLPEPLVDRALELKEYVLSAEQLTGALI